MLDGMILLDAGTKVVSYTWGWTWGGFIMGLLAILCIVISIFCAANDIGGYGVFVGGVICIIFSLFMFSHAKPAKIIPTYMVLIDDSISMIEFYDKYEILDVQGKIYTICERED